MKAGIDLQLQDRIFQYIVFKTDRVSGTGIQDFQQERIAAGSRFRPDFTHKDQKRELVLRGINPGTFGEIAAPENLSRFPIDAD